MGKIEKILKKGQVEGQTTEVYPVTSTKADYDENNKRLDNIITGLQESVYLKTPIPISTDNTTESKAQNVKNISDYIEKAKAAGISDVNGMGVTCLIDDYFSGVGYIMGNTDVSIHGIKTTDDLVDNRVFSIQNGEYYESKIQSENSNELSTTSKKLVPAINEVNTLAKSKGNGTITEVRMNGVSKGTSGVVDLGTVLTEHQDISRKQDKTDNTLATTDKTVIGAINEINTKVGNLTGALTWKGKLDTLPAVTDYEAGNVVSVGNKEYVLTVTGSTKAWEELGDEGSYLLKSAAEETYAKKTDIPTIPAIPTVNNPKVSIKMNGTEKGSFTLNQASAGEVDLGTVITAHQDISGKQDKLISGTNIKTINGESILGSGDITISSGASSSAYPEVNHGTGDTTFTLTPNTFHVWDKVTSLTLNFGNETSGVANEYLFQFTSGSTATSLTLPDSIKWANDNVPTIGANMIYQVSVLRGLASVLEFNNAIVFPTISPTGGSPNKEYAKVYGYFVNTYNLTSSPSYDPSNGVIITETLICNDANYGGPVLKVSLVGIRLLLWTQKAIDKHTVLMLDDLGICSTYFWG